MLKRLLQYEDFCKEHVKKSNLTKVEWITIHNIVKILNPVYTATIQLQESQLLLGNFYKLLLNLKCQLKKMRTNAAENLLNYMQQRESTILDNDIVNAAIFLDPRLKHLLSKHDKITARKDLKIVAQRMLELRQVCIERDLKIGFLLIIYVCR